MGGIWGIPLNREFFVTAASRLYTLLNEDGGTLLAQLHPFESLTAHGIPINKWVQELRSHRIVAYYVKEDRPSVERYWGAVKITRTPQSPPSIAGLLEATL